MEFPVFGALVIGSAALVGAWFVNLSALAQAGRLRTAGRVLAGWLVVLAILTVIGGAFAAGHHGRGPHGFGPPGAAMRMHGGPGRFGPHPGGRFGGRMGPPSAAAAQPAPAVPAAPAK